MDHQQNQGFLSIIGRLFWMMFGPILLVLMTVLIVQTGQGWLTGADFGYLGVLLAMMFGRWVEFRGGNPQTAEGLPAKPEHLHRYLWFLSLGGLAVWVAANVWANVLLDS